MSAAHRIEPIEKPGNLLTRIAYYMIKRQFGKVIMPAKIIYARYPSMFRWVKKMSDIEEKEVPLSDDLKLLVKYFVAWLNGCGFCMDIGEKIALNREADTEKFGEVGRYPESEQFSPAEKAALRFAEEANGKNVSDETFELAREHFTDEQLIGIAFIVATENFYNIMNHALGIESDQLCAIN